MVPCHVVGRGLGATCLLLVWSFFRLPGALAGAVACALAGARVGALTGTLVGVLAGSFQGFVDSSAELLDVSSASSTMSESSSKMERWGRRIDWSNGSGDGASIFTFDAII